MTANRMYLLAAVAVLGLSPGFAQDHMGEHMSNGVRPPSSPSHPTAGQGDSRDKLFLQQALEGSRAQIQLGHLALEASNDPQIKGFAQEVVDDYLTMIEKMKPAARYLGFEMPAALPKSGMKSVERLKSLSGDSFDRAYIEDMLKESQKDVADFKREAASTDNPPLRQLVEQDEEIIAGHLKDIQEIAKAKGLAGSRSGGQS
jgi:putative membrane protein